MGEKLMGDMAVPPDVTGDPATVSNLFDRGCVFSDRCPSREILKHVTSRWGVLLLVALLAGTHRFSDLRRKVAGISEKMLAQTLQVLEADGFVERTVYPVIPPHVEYDLTATGVEIAKRVEALADWIELNMHRVPRVQTQTNSVEVSTQ